MISRRHVLAGASALAATQPLHALGAVRCLDNTNFAIRTCEASLDIGALETARQACKDWCWAACIQTVFALHGRQIRQETAAQKLFGYSKCQAATLGQILAAISSEWASAFGVRFRATARELPLASLAVRISDGDPNARAPGYLEKLWATSGDARQLVEEIGKGRPLINLAVGHATVIESVTYQRNELFRNGPVGLTNIVVRDPWPASPNRRELRADEVRGTFHVIAIDVS